MDGEAMLESTERLRAGHPHRTFAKIRESLAGARPPRSLFDASSDALMSP
jgi:hypothetical protein